MLKSTASSLDQILEAAQLDYQKYIHHVEAFHVSQK